MNTETNTTTNAQIEQLRNEAAQAGDTAMVEICSIALGEQDPDPIQGYGYTTPTEARRLCTRAIADARAQQD